MDITYGIMSKEIFFDGKGCEGCVKTALASEGFNHLCPRLYIGLESVRKLLIRG